MVAVIGFLVFSAAMAVSVGVIAATVAPQWRRIAHLAMGNIEPDFQPLSALASAERRIAVRRWASARVPSAIRRMRAAA